MAANLSKTLLLIAIATCGAFIVVLSFMNWVTFEGSAGVFEFSLRGTEVSRIQGPTSIDRALDQTSLCTCEASFGDGYAVAALGFAVVAFTLAGRFIGRAARLLIAMGILTSLAAFVIAGYNATAIWKGFSLVGSPFATVGRLDGSVTFELYALTAIAAFGAVLGAVVLMVAARDARRLAESEFEAERTEIEEVSGWA